MTPPEIELREVTKEYAAPVVDRASLSLPSRGFVSILGPSGCGKSTVLKIAAGLLDATSGEVRFRGEDIDGPPFEVIYIFQQYSKSIFPWKTVLKNVLFGLENRGSGTRTENLERCREVIERVGLGGVENYYPRELSGGMQQRVAIARALVCEPAVMLMDEPFSAVDALTRNQLQDLLLDLWEQIGFSVLFVTHDVEEAIYLSGEVIAMAGPPGTVVERVDVPLGYPREQLRTRQTEAFLELRSHLLRTITRLHRTAERAR